ncbi:MAG: hypothetical protein SangKO_025400 [Sandaracinaceae bacterium]
MEIQEAIRGQSGNLGKTVEALMDGDGERAVASLMGALSSAAVGVPQLAPLATRVVSRLLVNETDRMLRDELGKMVEEERMEEERDQLVSKMRDTFQDVLSHTLAELVRDGASPPNGTSRTILAHADAVRQTGNIDSPLLHALHLIPTDRALTPMELFAPALMDHYATSYDGVAEARQAVNAALRIARAGRVSLPEHGDIPFPDRIKPRIYWEQVFAAFDKTGARTCGALLLVERGRVGRMAPPARRGYVLLWSYLVTGEIEPELITIPG